MRGQMLWFNPEKGFGFISTEEGERLLAPADGFPAGPPEGRCAGLDVTFEITEVDGTRRAEDVVLAAEAQSGRARLRHGGRSAR